MLRYLDATETIVVISQSVRGSQISVVSKQNSACDVHADRKCKFVTRLPLIIYMYSLLRNIAVKHAAAKLRAREANAQYFRFRFHPLQPTLVPYHQWAEGHAALQPILDGQPLLRRHYLEKNHRSFRFPL